MSNALQKLDGDLPVVRPEPTVAGMLQLVIERGITTDNVAAWPKANPVTFDRSDR